MDPSRRRNLTLIAALTLLAPPARALDVRTRYEDELCARALARHGLVLDPSPDGKRIERIVLAGQDVILPGDFPLSSKIPWTLANYLHVRTRDEVIARELLFSVGDAYRADVVDETGRNLRRLLASILSVARIVAARGTAPDRVVVVVVVKDLWSLRLNSEFTLDQGRLDFLSLSLAENNVAGRNKFLALSFTLDPGRYAPGLNWLDQRILGSRHFLRAAGALYVARDGRGLDGGALSITVGRPLFSLRTEWAWEARAFYAREKVRVFRGGEINRRCIGGDARMGCAGGVPVPEIYGHEEWIGTLQATRSWGLLHKTNLGVGVRASSVANTLTDELAAISPEAQAGFRALLPRSESAAGPFVSLATFRAEFVRLRNIDTFALTEDFRVGPELTVEARYASPYLALGSHFLELAATYGHLVVARDNLLSFSATLRARVQPGVLEGATLVNEEVAASVRNVTPPFGPFRLHVAARVRFRHHDLDQLRLGLGSSNGMRAFAPRGLIGNNLYVVNVELRTLPLNLWTIHVGAVAFYDGGDAPANWQTFGWHHGAGVGLRILLPQFNRQVIRLDLAFPFETTGGAWVPRFSAEFGQAF